MGSGDQYDQKLKNLDFFRAFVLTYFWFKHI